MFLHPEDILKQIHIGEGMTIIDVGSGIGHFTIRLGDLVGPHGKIYALDINDDLLVSLKNEAKRKNLNNIITIKTNVEKDLGLKGPLADRVIISNLLFQIDAKEEMVKKSAQLLKKYGKIVVVDWLDSFKHIGPHPKYIFPKAKAMELLKSAGLEFDFEIKAGDHHYGLVFKKTV